MRRIWFSFLLTAFLCTNTWGQEYDKGNVQDLLLNVSSKLVSDVENLKQQVNQLETENKLLKKRLDSAEQLAQFLQKHGRISQANLNSGKQFRIIVATFFHKPNADKFKSEFLNKTGLQVAERKTTCKGNSVCYAMSLYGNYTLYERLRLLGYRDAFFAKAKEMRIAQRKRAGTEMNRDRSTRTGQHRISEQKGTDEQAQK